MNKHFHVLLLLPLLSITLGSCIGSKLGSTSKGENTQISIREKTDVIDYLALKEQPVPDLASRGASRGPMTGIALGAVSLATNAVKQMIANDKKKYTSEYKYALTDLYFYDQLSTENPFDPIGLQFSGFRLVRTFLHDGIQDTAMIADFELDASNPYEIINNSIFRLRLKNLQLNYAKAKVPANSRFLNMDFEISFHTSYVNGQGQLFKNVELGKFYFFLRKAPLDKNAEGYTAYFDKLKGQKLEGQSFIVPRSFGYHMVSRNVAEPAYSQGAYTIEVNVKESSKNTFVNQMIIDNSGKLVDALGDQLKKKLK